MGIEKDSSEIKISGTCRWGETAHAKLHQVKRELRESLTDKYLFSFVRKPLDLLKSFYISKIYPEFVDFEDYKETNHEKISFKEFVYSKESSFATRLYTNYLRSPKGIFPYADYIGRTENLKEDLIEALEIAGEDFDKDVIRNMPPIRQGASLEAAKEVIKCDDEVLDFIREGEKTAHDIFYSEHHYSKLQQHSYDKLASLWEVNKRDFVVGSFDRQNKWKDYDFLFDGMFDFHNHTPRLPLAKECLVLDFGCGPGRNLEKYAPNFKRVDGVDISYININNAIGWLHHSQSYNDNMLFKSNGRDLSEIESDTYNAVMSTIALQHIPVHDTRFNLFREFYRVLGNGGWFTAQMGFGKGKFGAVDYYKNHYNAARTNGRTDVYVEDASQLEEDLIKVGFNDFQYWIRPAGPGDTHPNWIFFRAQK